MIQPTGSRVLVQPDAAASETDSGLIIPESANQDPAMSGTVVAVGRGADAAHKVRIATISRCTKILDELAERVPASSLAVELRKAFGAYEIAHVSLSGIKEGDRVCFPYSAGQAIAEDGQPFILLREDDIVATWTPDTEASV